MRQYRLPGWGARANPVVRRALLSFVAMLWLLFLLPSATHAGPVLSEQALPFDLGGSFPHPSVRVIDATSGSNGSVHILIQTLDGPFYVRANTSTGVVLESHDLAAELSSYGGPTSCPTLSCGVIQSFQGRLILALSVSSTSILTLRFDEGSFESASPVVLTLPLPPTGTSRTDLQALSFMPNESDAMLPSILWMRNVQLSSYPGPAIEVGRIAVDIVNGTIGQPTVWSLTRDPTYANVDTAPDSGWFDNWRVLSASRPIAGCIDANGLPWAFFAHHTIISASPPDVYAGEWYVVLPSGSIQPLLNLSNFALASVGCAGAGDGSIAAFVLAQDSGGSLLGQAVASNGTATALASVALPDSPTFALVDRSGGAPRVIVGSAVEGGVSPVGRIDQVTGWPGNLSRVTLRTMAQPAETGVLLVRGQSTSVLVGGLLDPLLGGPSLDGGSLSGLAYGRAWPSLIQDVTDTGPPTPMGAFESPVQPTIVGMASASSPNGTSLEVIVTALNGSNRIQVLLNSTQAGRYDLGTPLPVPGEAVEVQLVTHGSSFVLAARVQFPPSAYASWCGCAPWPFHMDYYVLNVSSQGTGSGGFFVLSTEGATLDEQVASPLANPLFRLSPSSPRPLLLSQYAISSLDLANDSADQLVNLTSRATWWPLFFPNTSQSIVLSSSYGLSMGSLPSSLAQGALQVWMDADDLYAAFAFYWDRGGSGSGCCHYGFRVVRFPAVGSPEWFDASLAVDGSGNDAPNPLSADVSIASNTGGSVNITLLLRQDLVWERLYAIEFSSVARSFGSVQLLAQLPASARGLMGRSLGSYGGDVVLLRTVEAGFQSITGQVTVRPSGLVVLGDPVETTNVTGRTSTCSLFFDPSCFPSFAVLPWAGAPALLVGFGGEAVFYTLNHPPTAPSPFSPSNGALLNHSTVSFALVNSTDEDGDVLSYRFVVYDGGTIVANVTTSSASTEVALVDGNYSWSCTVSDGRVTVDCTATFSFSIDATPPRADAGGPYKISNALPLALDGRGSLDARGIVRYDWTIGGGASAVRLVDAGPVPLINWSQLAPVFSSGDFAARIALEVWDLAGNNDTGISLVSLDFSPPELFPVLHSDDPTEGQPIALAVNISWAGANFSWQDAAALETNFTVYWTLPTGSTLGGSLVTFVPDDSGPWVVTVVVVPTAGPFGRTAIEVAVANAPPSAVLDGPAELREGEEAVFRISASDPSPVDSANLNVTWSVSARLMLVSANGTVAHVRASADGSATVSVRVADKDGASVTVEVSVGVLEGALPVAQVWIADSNTTWIDLEWEPTGEEDFRSYEVRVVFMSNGSEAAAVRTITSNTTDRLRIEGLIPGTNYSFTVVVVAKGGVVSQPAVANGATEPLPDAGTPGNGGPPDGEPGPEVLAGFDLGLLAGFLIGAGAVAAVALLGIRRRKD